MTNIFSRRDIIRRAQGFALASPFISLAACDEADARKPFMILGATMGTTYSVTIPRQIANRGLPDLEKRIGGVLENVNAQMSTYRPTSELSRFNDAPENSPVGVSSDTHRVVKQALEVSRLTGGAFDPTVGPLVDLWGFGPGGTRLDAPSKGEITDVFQHVGYQAISATESGSALIKNRSTTRLDLSGIAKGFAVDAIANLIEGAGIAYYLVEIGGEVRARGYSPRGDVWRVGIERPDGYARRRVVGLNGKALATSGNYRNFFESDGLRYPHIIDPRDGEPVRHGLASVTVIAKTAMQADALSTALMVIGPEAGIELARRNDMAAFFLINTEDGFKETVTKPFLTHLLT